MSPLINPIPKEIHQELTFPLKTCNPTTLRNGHRIENRWPTFQRNTLKKFEPNLKEKRRREEEKWKLCEQK